MPDPSVLNPSARVTLLDAPVASPGSCGLCGKPSHEKGFADPRLDFEFYGSLVFCADCTGDLASVFGYLAPEQYTALQSLVDAQAQELRTLRKAILGLESAVEGLSEYRDHYDRGFKSRGGAPEPDVSASPPVEPEITQQDEPVADSVPTELVNDGAAKDSQTDKLSGEQGRNDVRDAGSADVNDLLNL